MDWLRTISLEGIFRENSENGFQWPENRHFQVLEMLFSGNWSRFSKIGISERLGLEDRGIIRDFSRGRFPRFEEKSVSFRDFYLKNGEVSKFSFLRSIFGSLLKKGN